MEYNIEFSEFENKFDYYCDKASFGNVVKVSVGDKIIVIISENEYNKLNNQ